MEREGLAMFAGALALGLEGIVAKDARTARGRPARDLALAEDQESRLPTPGEGRVPPGKGALACFKLPPDRIPSETYRNKQARSVSALDHKPSSSISVQLLRIPARTLQPSIRKSSGTQRHLKSSRSLARANETKR